MLERIDRYELKERIGAGGQATVYLGEDTLLERTVAVKVLNQPVSLESTYVDAIMQEARLAAGLDHPNIATVYDFKIDGDYACIVMEYFPNSLDREIARSGTLPPARSIEIAAQICDALFYAHSRDLVHRDIKPHNILLDAQGGPRVTDFGIARATHLSVSLIGMGTPVYMSPEQCRGEGSPDVRSDIYSLGVTLYEMLSGRPPFEGTAPQLYQMHQNEPMPEFPPSLGVPKNLEAIVRKCMEKDPADRYQNAAELATVLRRLSEGSGARGAAPMPGGQGQLPSAPEEPAPTGRDWRRVGRYTVLGEIGPDDRQGLRRHVQAGADEVVIVRKNGEVADVFSEDRKPTRTFGEAIGSLVGLGPNTEVYKATKTRFNIVFWLGDEDAIVTGNKSFTFGLPVMTSDNQMVSARINLWIEIDEDLAENALLLLRGQDALSRFDIASEIREDLLGKVLGLELSQHTFDELRGNRPLLEDLGAAIQREISGTLGAYGLRIQDYSINWGLTLQERADIDQQRHQVAADHIRNLNEIEDLKNRSKTEDGPRSPMDVVLRPSKLQLAVTVAGLMTATFFLTRMVTDDFQQLPWQRQEAPAVVATALPAPPAIPPSASAPATAVPVPIVPEAPPDAYDPITAPLSPASDGNGLVATVPLEEVSNLTHLSRIQVMTAGPRQNAEVLVRRIRKENAPAGPQSVLILRNHDITLEGVKDSDNAGGEIEFEVKRSWLQDQNINAADVSLYRLHGEWSELPTRQTGQFVGAEDQLYEGYVAKTPGFSVFAVGVKIESSPIQASAPAPPTASVQMPVPMPTATVAPTPMAAVPPTVIPKPTITHTPVPTMSATPMPAKLPTATATRTPAPQPTFAPIAIPKATATPNPTAVAVSPVVKLSSSSVTSGGSIEVKYTGMAGNDDEWIGIYLVGDEDWEYKVYGKLDGNKSGTLNLTAPPKGGIYESRLFTPESNNTYNRVATSDAFKVLPPPTPTPTPTPSPSATPTLTPTRTPKGISTASYIEGEYGSNTITGRRISVEVGSNVNASVIVNLLGSDGNLTTEIWKDISTAADERVKICPHSAAGRSGIRDFSCWFTADELTTGSFRQYYFKVYWDGEAIYDPTDPGTREALTTEALVPTVTPTATATPTPMPSTPTPPPTPTECSNARSTGSR